MSNHEWCGHKILHPDHIQDLEHAAAVHEFEHGLSREEAEAAAHQEYKNKHHESSAAHHLRGLRIAQAAGDIEGARKHGTVYGLHMEALGHDPMDAVPKHIDEASRAGNTKQYSFKAHSGDRFLL